MTQYEVRYEDKKGRYTEETDLTGPQAMIRAAELEAQGIGAEVWEVQKSERRTNK